MKNVQIRSFFWPVFSRIPTEYGEILRISPYSVRMWENTHQIKLHFSRSSQEKFGLIWQVVFKLEYLFCQGRILLLGLNKDGEKLWVIIFCKQAIIKLLLAYSFRRIIFTDQNLKFTDVFFSWTVDLLLISSSRYFLFEIWFFTASKNYARKYILQRKEIMK